MKNLDAKELKTHLKWASEFLVELEPGCAASPEFSGRRQFKLLPHSSFYTFTALVHESLLAQCN